MVHRTRYFVLYCHILAEPARSEYAPLVGIFASRRVGGAVQRNKARRRIREAYRQFRPAIHARGARLVFQSRQPAVDSPFAELADAMRRVLEEAGVLNCPDGPKTHS